MFFYILFLVFFSCLLLFGYLFPKKEKLLSLAVFVLIVLIAGLRYRVGGDYDSYVSWYLHKTRDYDLEFGFVAVMQLFRSLRLSTQFLFFFFSFFTYFFVYLGIKKFCRQPNVAFLFYILIPTLFLTSLNLVRQSFSVAISFYALYYLIHKKYFIFFMLMLVGISIHNTCIIPLIVFPFVVKIADKIKVKHLFVLLIVSLIMATFDFVRFFAILFENTRYSFYFSDQRIPVNFIKIIVLNFVAIFVLVYFDKLKIVYPYQKYLSVLYFLSVVSINILSPLDDLSRIYTYFRIFEIVVVADLIFLETNRKRIFLFSFFYLLYFGAFLNGIKKDFESKNRDMPQYIPYNNILWSKPQDR